MSTSIASVIGWLGSVEYERLSARRSEYKEHPSTHSHTLERFEPLTLVPTNGTK